jgi:hypothetical protein
MGWLTYVPFSKDEPDHLDGLAGDPSPSQGRPDDDDHESLVGDAAHPMVNILNQAGEPSIERGDFPGTHVSRHLFRVERFPSGNSRHQGFFPAP